MIIVTLAVLAGVGAYAAAFLVGDWGWGWSVFAAVLGFGVVQLGLGFLIQRKVKAEMDGVQKILLAGQKRIEEKMRRWQVRPPSSQKAAQIEIAANTKEFVKAAIEATDNLKKFKIWVPMMDRQIATAKFQLCWMIKDFKQVDALIGKAIFIDPTMSAMKMARMYMTGAKLEDIRKVYRKAVRRTRYNGNVLLAAAMSWIEVKRDDPDGAFKTLTEALKKSDNETLKANHERLMNNRVAHFTNSGIGDTWYALMLEEPKVHAQRQHMPIR